MIIRLLILLLPGWAVQRGLASSLLESGDGEATMTQGNSAQLGANEPSSQFLEGGGGIGERAAAADLEGVVVTATELDRFKRYAQWAGASYCDPVADVPVYCKGDICPAGGDKNATVYDVFYGTTTDILAFLALSPRTSEIILSVRGPSSLAPWLHDVLWTGAPTPLCDGCTAHLGLLTAYHDLVGPLHASLTTALARHPGYRVTFTGHSLGGAVATLLALHFRDALRGTLLSSSASSAHGPHQQQGGGGGGVALYTFGSPRVGNLALAAYVTQQQSGSASGGNYRVTHRGDVVPRVPPAMEGFRHVSPEYWLGEGGPRRTRTVYGPSTMVEEECDGYANAGCNAGEPWWEVDVQSHLYYLVAITHCGGNATRLSFSPGDGDGVSGTEGGRFGNGTGPVNGTTATNHSGSVGGLSADTVNRLAMYAKLDQEFMAALQETGGETKMVF